MWAVSVYKDSNFSIDYQVFSRLICAKLRKVVQRCMTLCSVAQNVLFHVVPLHCHIKIITPFSPRESRCIAESQIMLHRSDFEITSGYSVAFVGDPNSLDFGLQCPSNLTKCDLLDLLSYYYDFYQRSLCKGSLVRIFTDFINGSRTF